MTESWTVLKLLRWTADYFKGRGIDSPRLDAELLLAATLGLDRVGLYLNFERPLQTEELAAYRERVRRRAGREPLAYILGHTEFWSLPLKVTRDVLIPRPDTELLVEQALQRVAGPARMLDVGTGSGALAIALAHEKPEWQVKATDISAAALAIAAENARTNGLEGRIDFLAGDLAALPAGPFDLIVSNPPYIPAGDLAGLMSEVRDFEPRLALDGGDDGLDAYRALARQAGKALAPGGWLLVEVGIDQSAAVQALFAAAGLTELYNALDLAGIERVVGGRKSL